MNTVTSFLLGGAALALALTGCSEYADGPGFGDAERADVAIQTVNHGGIPPYSIPGLEGAATKANMDRYLYSFVAPQAQGSALGLGLGAGGTGGTPQAAPAGYTP